MDWRSRVNWLSILLDRGTGGEGRYLFCAPVAEAKYRLVQITRFVQIGYRDSRTERRQRITNAGLFRRETREICTKQRTCLFGRSQVRQELKKRRRQRGNSRGKRICRQERHRQVKMLRPTWMGEQGTYMYYKYPLPMFASAEGGGNKIGALGGRGLHEERTDLGRWLFRCRFWGFRGLGKLGFPCDTLSPSFNTGFSYRFKPGLRIGF